MRCAHTIPTPSHLLQMGHQCSQRSTSQTVGAAPDCQLMSKGSPTANLKPPTLKTPAADVTAVTVLPLAATVKLLSSADGGTPSTWIASIRILPLASPAFEVTVLLMLPDEPSAEAAAVNHTCVACKRQEQKYSQAQQDACQHATCRHGAFAQEHV